MPSLVITQDDVSRVINLPTEVNEDAPVKLTIGDYFFELTTDEDLAGELPRIRLNNAGVDYWIRETFEPEVFSYVISGNTAYLPVLATEATNHKWVPSNNTNDYGTAYGFTVDWGDGSTNNYVVHEGEWLSTTEQQNSKKHVYTDGLAEHTVTLSQTDGYTNVNWLYPVMFFSSLPDTLLRVVSVPSDPFCYGIDGQQAIAYGLFAFCSSLTSLPDTFTLDCGLTTLGGRYAYQAFCRCSSLVSLPAGFKLPAGTIDSTGELVFYCMFQECTSLAQLPAGFNLPACTISAGSTGFAYGMFYGCIALTSLPDGFNLPTVWDLSTPLPTSHFFASRMFYYCSALTELPAGFNLPSAYTRPSGKSTGFASYMFCACQHLTNIRDLAPPVANCGIKYEGSETDYYKILTYSGISLSSSPFPSCAR